MHDSDASLSDPTFWDPSLWPLYVLVLAVAGIACTDSAPSSTAADRLTGTWTIAPDQSTAIDPWRDLTVEIAATDARLTLKRIWQGHYGYATVDSVTIPIDGAAHRIPLTQWADNRHIGAFVGGDSTKRVAATWVDDGTTLQVTTRLTVRTSQGPTPIRTHSEYRVAPNDSSLTLLELRSTRPRPIRYTLEASES